MAKVLEKLGSLESGVSGVVASELLEAAGLLGSSRRLRTALSDPSAGRSSKERLVGAIFREYDGQTIDLLQTIAAARWSDANGLVAAVAETGQRAASVSTDVDVAAELFEVARVVSTSPELELALGSRAATGQAKAVLIERIFGSSVSSQTLAIVRELATRPRGRRFHSLVATAAQVVADQRGYGLATVTSASTLDDARLGEISSRLAGIYGRPFSLNTVVDPKTEGGVRVQAGNDVYDGTVMTRLAELRLQLAG